MSLLSGIREPSDLKRLRRDQLPELAQEIRDRLEYLYAQLFGSLKTATPQHTAK